MDIPSRNINRRIAAQARGLRAAMGLSLDALASKSGVSRSMISLIERGEASPPAVRRAAQPQWRDPASGYLRRNVSPPHWPSPIKIVEVDFPAGARVAYETGSRDPPVHQQVWLLTGRLQVTLGDEQYRLDAGDCLAMLLDRPTVFANRTRDPARYVVVVSAET